ncbi:hypothetical protein SAMN04489714_0234 [Schaalia radingae]|uniref:Colicin import membrane protein n=2 Tax=Schaalia radingae TaxID=131110 RepID=A0ABY0V540_9ACTO|nr:hypothetical protein SAMN04489714_0234 [Schaalia radingae]
MKRSHTRPNITFPLSSVEETTRGIQMNTTNTPAVEDRGDAAPNTSEIKPAWYKRKLVLIALSLALVAVLAAVSLIWHAHAATAQARSAFEEAQDENTQAQTDLRHAQADADALTAMLTDRASDLQADECNAARQAAQSAPSAPTVDNASELTRAQLENATKKLTAHTDTLTALTKRLKDANTTIENQLGERAEADQAAADKQLADAIQAAKTAPREGVDSTMLKALDDALETAQTDAPQSGDTGQSDAQSASQPESTQSNSTLAVSDSVRALHDRFEAIDATLTQVTVLKEATTSVNEAHKNWADTQAKAKAQADTRQDAGNTSPYDDNTGYTSNEGSNDWNGGNAVGNGGYSDGGSSSEDVCGGGQYCYNPNFPEWIQDNTDGSWHHQVTPDENGNVIGDVQGEICVGDCS